MVMDKIKGMRKRGELRMTPRCWAVQQRTRVAIDLSQRGSGNEGFLVLPVGSVVAS